jgi:2-polyprenyl-6-hydroxyphenyl methylase/3-demethylubiquinone-9 3-methyltransferase
MSTSEYYERYWTPDGYNLAGGSGVTAQVRRIVLERVTASTRALDMGCGNGRTGGPLLLDRGASYTGVDISQTAVAAAREFGLDARVIEDASSLPFDSGSFDFVLCMEVLEHLFRPDFAAAEMARVLRQGGVALITVPNVAYWRRRIDLAMFGRWNPTGDDQSGHAPWRDPHIRFFQISALRRLLGQSGFDQIEVGGHDGGVLRDLPGLRRIGRGGVSHLYRRLERAAPSLFAGRLHAVATRRG